MRSLPITNLFKRDFRNFNEREFEETVLKTNWENICNLGSNETNLSCNNYFNSITYLLDEFAPFRKVSRKEYKLMLKPWISKEILRKCKGRDSILKCISKEMYPAKQSALRDDYKKLRNEITKGKRDSKKSYYSSYFERNKEKSSEIWKGINSLVNIKSSKTSNIKLIDDNNNLVSDPGEISHKFNHYISTIGPDIERKIPTAPGSFNDYFNKKGHKWKLLINLFNSSFFPFTYNAWRSRKVN